MLSWLLPCLHDLNSIAASVLNSIATTTHSHCPLVHPPPLCPPGTKLTYLPFVIKALSISLGKYPGLNTCLEPGGGALLQHHSHNIGIAMATSNGLVVPNIKQVRELCC